MCIFRCCWLLIAICAADWQSHNREYYECSRYKAENESSGASAKSKAREALNRYLFYFERVSFFYCSVSLHLHKLCICIQN